MILAGHGLKGRTGAASDRGGHSLSMVGVDGVRSYGSHLEAVAAGIAPGVRVRAGGNLSPARAVRAARAAASREVPPCRARCW